MEIPYTVTARPDTGLWNAKIGIWLFLASEVMLFGGLFSSYIFLRIGADYHWPIHELNVKMGCFNTAVLIGSSVTVVMAWAGVKMRNYRMYFFNLLATILCAFTFLGVKFFEYKTKIEHYGVVLKDGTILLGHQPEEGYRFEYGDVSSMTVNVKESDAPYVLADCRTANPKFKTPEGVELALETTPWYLGFTHWFGAGTAWEKYLDKARTNKVAELKLTPTAPLEFHALPRHTTGHTATGFSYLDGTTLEGKLITDAMELHVDVVDLRSTPDADKSLAWSLLKDHEWKEAFDEQKHHHLEAFEHGKHHGQDPLKEDHFLREAMRWEIHGDTPAAHEAKHKLKPGFFDDMPWAHHRYPTVKIEAKDIERWSNFLPKWNTYYAIYFTITGLHGAHVLAGALVMLYFLIFNSRWFKTDPEHLANRVETGGLFWHFVDLVWIFLFPLLYLL